METPSTILAAVDRSPLAIRVVKNAIDLAKSMNAALHFLFVELPYGEPIDKTMEAHRRLFINEQVDAIGAQKIQVTHAIRKGDQVAVELVRYATDNNCDLIVMGSRGRRGFRKLMLGSVALEVMRSAPCPVFTVGGKDETDPGHNPLSQILVPFDFSDHSMGALAYAARFAEQLNSNLDVLHIIEDTFYPAFYGPFTHSVYETTPNIEDLVKEKMRRCIELVDFDLHRTTLSVLPGHPGSEIANYADDNAIDLIIMATHGLSGMQHLFMGSVAERTAQLAKCPVLTLRLGSEAEHSVDEAVGGKSELI